MENNKPIVLYGNVNGMKSHLGKSYDRICDRAITINFGNEYDTDIAPSALLLISWCQFKGNEREILVRAQKAGLAILIIADGILEWRNTWNHPAIAPGVSYQPIVGHKMACLGRSQARILESWGNLGKCEIVGAPRFDSLLGRKPRKRKEAEPFRVLVMTAKTLGFTSDQLALAKRAVQDLKFWFSQHVHLNGVRLEVIWRITQGLEKEIGVENQLSDLSGKELADVLQEVDAVITTPSTTMLEAMMIGVPVALLDYNNCPHYVQAAWRITAPRHLDQVMPELIAPPAPRMLFQSTVLHDALECRTPAAPRMIELIEEMVRIANDSRSRNKPLVFPDRILEDKEHGHHMPEELFDMRTLYPEHPVFSEMDRSRLQVEVGHLQKLVNDQQKQINNQKVQIEDLKKRAGLIASVLHSFPGPKKLLRWWRNE